MRLTGFFLLFISIFQTACHDVRLNQSDTPENLLSFQEMVEVAAEAYMIESALRMNNEPEVETPYYSLLFYEALLQRNDITAAVFFENLSYYTSDLEKTQEFYNAVQEHLNTIQEKQVTESN